MFFRAKPEERLRLVEVMRLRQAYLPQPPTAEAERCFEEAKRRCLACNFKKLCDESLAAGRQAAFGAFCPNTHYIQHVRTASLRFR